MTNPVILAEVESLTDHFFPFGLLTMLVLACTKYPFSYHIYVQFLHRITQKLLSIAGISFSPKQATYSSNVEATIVVL